MERPVCRWPSGLHAVPLLLLCAVSASYGADLYNPSNKQLSIPAVAIGSANYSNMVVIIGGLIGGPSGALPYGSVDRYDPASNQLTVPSVKVSNSIYNNVVGAVSGLVSVGSVSGADSYDGSHLSIATVQAGSTAYYNVVISIGSVVRVAGGMPAMLLDWYDRSAGQLTIPAVQYGARVYTNVTVTVGAVLSVGASSSASQSGTVLYLSSHANGHAARVGVDTAWGGAIVELSMDGTNFVNAHDTGREVQPALYDGADQYPWPDMTVAFGWDPVLGGDYYDVGSKVLSQQFGASSLYTRATPLQWNPAHYGGGAGDPVPGDMTFEQTVTVAPGGAAGFQAHYKMTHNGTDTHYNTGQEFPAVYANSAYTNFSYYGGTNPWTNGALTAVSAGTNPSGYAPEHAASLVDANNQGLTVFVPGVYPFWIASWPSQSGGGGPAGNETVYMRPLAMLTIQPGEVIEGDVYLIPGDTTSARAAVYALHQLLPDSNIMTPIVSVDAPIVNATITGSAAPVFGWAFGRTAVIAARVFVDGVPKGNATLGGARPDVAAAYPNMAPVNCGWDYSLDTTALANGPHSIVMHIMDASNNEALIAPVTVTVSN